jgi:hypothetical protein
MNAMKSTLLIAVALSCVSAVTSVADSTKFVAPAFRGQPNADFAGWEVFTVPTGANNPDVGGGNIYAGPFAIGAFSVSYDVSSPLATVVFQVRTLGLEPNYNSISLNYGSGTLTAARTELERATDNSMPGSMAVTSSWTWDLTGVNATALTINLGATTPHVVLDAAQLDVAAVPEPETWAMISGVGLLAFAVWRRR